MNLSLVYPRAQQTIHLTLSADATVDDLIVHLVAKDPRLVGCKIVYAGQLLAEVNKRLSEYGVHDNCTLHLVPVDGNSASPQSPPPATQREQPRAPYVSPRTPAAQTSPATQQEQPRAPYVSPRTQAPQTPSATQQEQPPSVSPRKPAQTPPPAQSPRETSPEAILDKLTVKLNDLRAQATPDATEKQRKMLYEASMKVLLETDGLIDLPEALRERRRAFVREVTAFQDSLQV